MGKLKIINIGLVIILFIASCEKDNTLKKQIGGKYDIALTENVFQNWRGCNGDSEIVNYSVSNPGRMVFTNKKAIQGPASSMTYRPYVGYFEYEIETVAGNGTVISMSDKTYFQYDFPTHSFGSYDTVQAHIYINSLEMDLLLEQDDNGDITAFYYQNYSDDCYKGVVWHYVK